MPAEEISPVWFLSRNVLWFLFPAITQTKGAQRAKLETKNVELTELVGKNDDESVKEMETCLHFLVKSEIENSRNKVFTLAMDVLDAHILSRKLDTMFKKHKRAEKVNIECGFALKNEEDGNCRYYYACEYKNLRKQSTLVATKGSSAKNQQCFE